MQKKLLYIIILTCIMSFSSIIPVLASQLPPAMVLDIYTSIPTKKGYWVTIPKGVDTITIFAKAVNTDTVLFWLVPTGSQTWGERKLIGYDTDGSDGWSVTWKFGKRKLHDHIVVQAIGIETVSQSSINVVTPWH